jgi:hypothetical protein
VRKTTGETIIAPDPSKAAKRVTDRTLGGLLNEDESKSARPPAEFLRDLGATFQSELLDSMGSVTSKQIENMLNFLYGVAQAMADAEREVSVARKTPKLGREHRVRFAQARVHVLLSADELKKAKKALGHAGDSLKRGALRFRPVEEGLKDLSRALLELEIASATIVHPSKRTPLEKKLAAKVPQSLWHTPLKLTPGSAEINYQVVEILDEALRKFTRGRVPSNHIDRFIVKFFLAALGRTVSEANVKVMRIRIREQGKDSSFTDQPQ